MHLIPQLGAKKLDAIATEDVQHLKQHLGARKPKTVNNVLTVLNTMLRKAVEWGVVGSMPCAIRLLPIARTKMEFYDFTQFERLVDASKAVEVNAHLISLLGGDAGLRCGEMMALEWRDIDLAERRLCVSRSEWKGQVTAPKGGRFRFVPLTQRLVDSLSGVERLGPGRVLRDGEGHSLTQRAIQGLMLRSSRVADVPAGVHILRHTFCSHLAMRGAPGISVQALAGHQDLATTQRYLHLTPAALVSAINLLETGRQSSARHGEILETASA